MDVTVIGGSGCIGGHLVAALLQAGHSVRIVDRRPSARFDALRVAADLVEADATTRALRGCEAVIDLAAPPLAMLARPGRYRAEAAAGAAHLIAGLEAEAVPRLLYNSSVAVYGPQARSPNETCAPAPHGAYALAKHETELAYRAWQAREPATRSLTLVRACAIYGENDRGNIHRLITQLRRGRFALVGDGRNRKAIAYVGNLVDFLRHCLDFAPGVHLLNYADPDAPTTAELVDEIRALLPTPAPRPLRVPRAAALLAAHAMDALAHWRGVGSPFSAARVRSFCAETALDTTRAEASGFRPRVGREEALRRTIAALPSADA